MQASGTGSGTRVTLTGSSAANPAIDPYTSFLINDAEPRLQLCATNSGSNAAAIILSNESKHFVIHQRGPIQSNSFDIAYQDIASPTDMCATATPYFRISTGGQVTKPYNPAFIAGRTGGNETHTVGTFPLNVARLNVGNHYNTSTYKFTAPVAGVYYFYAQVYYNNGAGQYRMGFRKTPSGGSALMLNTSSHKAPSNDSQNSMSIVESLAVGDTVELYSDSNYSIQCYYNINNNNYGAHTYFMGYLIG